MTISRTYHDPAGTRWSVTQWLVGSRPTDPPVPALIFSTRGGSLQVRDFPRNWMNLPDEELERLRTSAARAMARPPVRDLSAAPSSYP